ncbi:hypothetical protein L7F22_001049 [Adiantum nelumboides]|nr:hypothetical protein [Adiantum nelumboides]
MPVGGGVSGRGCGLARGFFVSPARSRFAGPSALAFSPLRIVVNLLQFVASATCCGEPYKVYEANVGSGWFLQLQMSPVRVEVGSLLYTSTCTMVPFEEDDKDPSIWFLDHNYHETMFDMFKRINAKEHVVGWYSTGPKLRENDLNIHELFRDYLPNPVLVIIDVQPKEIGIPTKAYYAVEEVKEDATQKSQKVFVHVASEIGAYEAEEIGVEHLLRDVKDTTISTLATEVSGKLTALKGLESRLKEIHSYLDYVIDGKLPLNHEILYHLQDVFNLLPNLNVNELVKSFAVKTNDMMLVIYLASVIRSVIALHNLINNKVLNKEHEKLADGSSGSAISAAG